MGNMPILYIANVCVDFCYIMVWKPIGEVTSSSKLKGMENSVGEIEKSNGKAINTTNERVSKNVQNDKIKNRRLNFASSATPNHNYALSENSATKLQFMRYRLAKS